MAIEYEYENNCLSCDHCINCGQDHQLVAHLICDHCGEESEKLYDTENGLICKYCMLNNVYETIDEEKAIRNKWRYMN